MGSVISHEEKHYIGSIANYSSLILSSFNLSKTINYEYTKKPFYLVTENGNIKMKMFDEIINYNNILVFILKKNKNNSFVLKLKDKDLYLGMDLNKHNTILSEIPTSFILSDTPNNKETQKDVFPDKGYILKHYDTRNTVNFIFDKFYDNNLLLSGFDQIRLLPTQGYHKETISGLYLPINQNIVNIVENDVFWSQKIFSNLDFEYKIIYMDINDCPQEELETIYSNSNKNNNMNKKSYRNIPNIVYYLITILILIFLFVIINIFTKFQ